MNKTRIIPGPRLLAVARMVPSGSRCADIGCDHALLSIYLITEGLCTGVLASDVAAGPMASARRNVSRAGLEDRITLIQADGLDAVPEYKPDCVIIAGMGGELIAQLIERSEYIRSPEVRLIVQPMSRAAELFSYMAASGFAVEDEQIVRDAGRLYRIVAVRFNGIARTLTYGQTELGERLLMRLQNGSACNIEIEYASKRLAVLERQLKGMDSGSGSYNSFDPEQRQKVQATINEIRKALGSTVNGIDV